MEIWFAKLQMETQKENQLMALYEDEKINKNYRFCELMLMLYAKIRRNRTKIFIWKTSW